MQTTTSYQAQFEFAYNFLGPIHTEFCRRLWLYHEAYIEQNAVSLFCARGGLRQKILYEKFLKKMNYKKTLECNNFMISRLLASKVCFKNAPSLVTQFVLSEFKYGTIAEVAQSFLPKIGDLDNVTLLADFHKLPVNQKNVNDLFFGDSQLTSIIKLHLNEQYLLFNEYLSSLIKNHRTAILVDTGLFGSTQMYLNEAYKNINWSGLYFGRSNYRKSFAPHFNRTTGIILEWDEISALKPETAFLKYWHIVEAPLEPNLESVSYLSKCSQGYIKSNLEIPGWENELENLDNPFFAGIVSYIENLKPEDSGNIRKIYKKRLNQISNKIMAPSISDLKYMVVQDRSFDYGREGSVGILFKSQTINPFKRFIEAKHSLWKRGQLVKNFGILMFIFLRVLLFSKKIKAFIDKLIKIIMNN